MFYNCKPSITRCTIASDAPIVPQGLAVTPTQVASMTERGVAVTAANGNLSSSEGVPDPVLLFEQRRGVDIADAWNASQDAKVQLVKGHKKDKDYYN